MRARSLLGLGLVALGLIRCAGAPPTSPEPAPPPPAAPVSVAPPPAASAPEPEQPEPIAWPPSVPSVKTAWCTDDVTALDPHTCVAFPDRPSRTLLIYLHGLVPPGMSNANIDNLEQAVANAARRAGVVAMIPLGQQGLAPKNLKKYWGWPTGPSTYKAYAESLIHKIEEKQRALEASVGQPFEVRYLAGTSAGAYFVARLAMNGDFDAQGFGAMSGGSDVPTRLDGIPPRPFYIGYGTHDPVAKTARELGERLLKAGWPVSLRGHNVGHGTREIYVDEALAFWKEAGAP